MEPTTATANNNDADLQPRKIPRIKKQDVRRNSSGNSCYSEWFIRLPVNLIFQDLNDFQSEIWRDVQKDRNTALGRFDNVRLVSADEAWFCDATVVDANAAKVVLAGYRKVDLVPRDEVFFSPDGLYVCRWGAGGYEAFRRAENGAESPLNLGKYDNLERCRHELMQRQYSKRA